MCGAFGPKYLLPVPVALMCCCLNVQAVFAQGSVQTTIPGSGVSIQIPTSPFNDAGAIHAQQDAMRQKGAMLDYGVTAATQAKTSLSDFQAKLKQAIAANDADTAGKILGVSQQTVAQAAAIDAYVYRFVGYNNSQAGRDHSAADANLAAAKQTLAQMYADYAPLAKRELASARETQAAQDRKIAEAVAVQREEAWDKKIAGSLGELSACFPNGDVLPPETTNCNAFVGHTLDTVYGIPDFRRDGGGYKSANEIADILLKSPEKWELIGLATSQDVLDQAANYAASRPVIAVWSNPDPSKHGHVVLIGPGPLQDGWGMKVPYFAGFAMHDPQARKIGDKLSLAFGKDKQPAVMIYVRKIP
jgi:hypothetical protein